MIGVIVNVLSIVLGSWVGFFCKKGIPDKISSAVMRILGLFVLSVGIVGVFKGENLLVLPVSLVLGTIVGELLDIDAAIVRLGTSIERKTNLSGGFTQGFVTGTLLFCVGAMSVVGAIQAGTAGDHSILYAKAALDGIESIMLSATMGIGIMVSSMCVLIVEGGVALLSGIIAPILTDAMISEMTCVGSILIMAVGFNLMEVTKFKAANSLPAILLAPFLSLLFQHLGIG